MQSKALVMAAVVLLGGSMGMRAQTSGTVKDDLFAGTEKFAQNASSVTEVDMDPDSLDKVNGHNATRARRTVLSVVHTYTYDKPGMYNMADVDAFRNKLNTGDWHCSIHVRELKSGESTDVCRKHRSDDLEEQAIITVEPRELTFIHTIKRPSTPGTPGKPGAPEAFLDPMSLGMPIFDGLPRQAWAAEMRANAAEMRAEMMISRAEMGALAPGVSMNLFGDRGLMLYSQPGLDGRQMDDLKRQLQALPELKRFSPWMQEPEKLAVPAVPAVPKAPAPPSRPESLQKPIAPEMPARA